MNRALTQVATRLRQKPEAVTAAEIIPAIRSTSDANGFAKYIIDIIDPREQVRVAELILGLVPENEAAAVALGFALLDLQEHERAMEVALRAKRLFPNSKKVLEMVLQVYSPYNYFDFNQALATRLREVDAHTARGAMYLARLYALKGNRPRALAALAEAEAALTAKFERNRIAMTRRDVEEGGDVLKSWP